MGRTSRVSLVLAFCLAVIAAPVGAGGGGGRYPMNITKVQGRVEVRLERAGNHWRTAKTGSLLGGPYLLRTGSRSYAHLFGKFRCLDANSLIRINFDSEASIDVLRGRMSAVDGRRGRRLPDEF